MALILCIETSARHCTVAVAQDGNCLVQKQAEGEFQHSKQITLLIEACLEEANLNIQSLQAVAVSKGPGSYTGLRVGVSCAKGLCYASKLPLIAISTLKLIAFPFKQKAPTANSDQFIVPMIDARRMEVYYEVFHHATLETVEAVDNLILENNVFESYRDKSLLFCGDGAFKMKPFLQNYSWLIQESYPQARNMTQLAEVAYQSKGFEDLAYFTPFYFKPPNITKSKKQLF